MPSACRWPPAAQAAIAPPGYRIRSETQQCLLDRRMQMEMVMRIHMIERKAGRSKRFELRADFRRKLTPRSGQAKEPYAVRKDISREATVAADKSGNPFWRAATVASRPMSLRTAYGSFACPLRGVSLRRRSARSSKRFERPALRSIM